MVSESRGLGPGLFRTFLRRDVSISDMRDHRKLEAFQLAHQLVLAIYRVTAAFPSHELFGLTSQMRRAAVSGAANIVEGSARRTEADFLRFLDISFSSLREVEYYIQLSRDLEYLSNDSWEELAQKQSAAAQKLGNLIRYFRS